MNTTSKKVIIIGASSGIGKALCLQLVKENHLVGITGRRAGLLDELKTEYPERIFCTQMDNTDITAVEAQLDRRKFLLCA